MKKWWALVAVLFVVIVGGTLILFLIPAPMAKAPTTGVATTTSPAVLDDLIIVTSPLPNSIISSTTITITGKARGTFYFEASFPVKLKDASGMVIAQGPAQAQSDWMTTDFVPFTISLTFPAQPAGSKGTLILTNDNPSGDPAKQKTLDIPITF